MANIIALVWDFDKTLVNGYMEDPVFEFYNVNPKVFWDEVNALPAKYMREQKVKVNPDTIYLNHMIRYAREGKFEGLNNDKLYDLGKNLRFYDGIPDIFERTQALIEKEPIYAEYDIKLEHYIVSTGISQVIRGSSVARFAKQIWGCEFIEGPDPNDKSRYIISEVGYSLDNTTKTRALFEINKGVGLIDDMTVNTKIPEEHRRVHFINMVYVADGPSDVPAFSVVNQNGGATFAIYPKGDMKALKQVEQMRADGRINMYAEADYSEGTTAFMWLCNKITEFAERIRVEERQKQARYTDIEPPKHLMG
ncbi:haloacid dehalogenase-like hydrolase [Synergistes jonesii]|uniref:Haloacid dehalogenase-like hydrolase n=1 Tax=Synergistes jonesii TaxID=2754 RepID=A0A073IUU6_9BACT|nr:haloacid dehalogenase-like hydrolase [Synergistes jonesii]KEJ93365.1 hypothetical protein EH55_08680 [Synergistes jonesii]OFB65119.1 hypothetical protein JS73_01185 [Synergistes jonesii]OFB65934.1 hypothetical protein JS72_00305 [Synergistes jonesii]OFB66393.1 hypothetical protein JS79_01195 [Synergistes jonesii]OFB69107.1 hypothetical protein JS78_01195 [Synergistes jonesii]